MSARTLTSLTLYSATGTPVAVPSETVGAFGSVRVSERIPDPPRLTLTGIEGGALLDVYAAVERRAIVRAAFGAEVTYWRTREVSTGYGESQAWSAACDPLWLDLDGTVVSETVEASGFVDVGVTVAGTVGEVVARLLSPASGAPSGLVTFALGTVAPALAAKRVLVTLTGASALDGLRQALRSIGAEVVFTATDGTSGALCTYTVDVVERIGADTGARIMAGAGTTVNRFGATRKRDDAAYFSHLVATANGDSPVTLASAAWLVTSASYFAGVDQTALSLGGEPVWEDGALEGLFVRNRLGGALYEVLATEAPYVVVVEGDASGLDGSAILFREAGDRDLVALPAAHAAHGRRLRRQTFDVAPHANALVEAGASADLSTWAGGVPVGWSPTGGASLALVASEGHVRYGTASVQVTAPQHGGLLSGPLDRLDARTVSAWVAAYVTSPGGRIRLEILDEDGTVHPVGQKVDSTSETLQALSIGGAPLTGTTFRVRIVADSPTATFIVDAATVTRSATAEAYSERMGPAALWIEAAHLLFDEGGDARLDAIEGRLFDLSAVVSGYDEIRIGDVVTASEEGLSGFTVTTRVVEIDETFQTDDASTEKRIRLSQRRADLRHRLEATPTDPVPVVDPVRRAAPSAQYGVGYRYTAGGDAVVVLSWLGSGDVRSVRWTLTVGATVTSGTADAASGSLELNPGAPVAPGTTIEVRASAYSEDGATGEVEAAPYRLVTDVPIASASAVLTGRTISVLGTTGEVSVLGASTQALDANPSFTLGLADDVRVTSSVGVLGGAFLKAHAATTDHLAVMASSGADYGYVVAKGFLIYEGGTSYTRLEGEVVRVSDNLIRLNSDATTPAAWGGVFVHRGSAAGKGVLWNETTGRWGAGDVTVSGGSETIETATHARFLMDGDNATLSGFTVAGLPHTRYFKDGDFVTAHHHQGWQTLKDETFTYLYAADKRFTVTVTGHSLYQADVFNGVDGAPLRVNAGGVCTVRVNLLGKGLYSSDGLTYMWGDVYVGGYGGNQASAVRVRWRRRDADGGQWQAWVQAVDVSASTSYRVWRAALPLSNYLVELEVEITAPAGNPAWVSSIFYIPKQVFGTTARLDKRGAQELWYAWRWMSASATPAALVTIDPASATPLLVAGVARFTAAAQLDSTAGTSAFVSGWTGSGWRGTAAGAFEMQSLTVRGTLSVYELLARRVDAVGGNLLVAPRIKASAVTGSGPYVITDEFASALGGSAVSDAEVGAFMIAQTATASGVAQSVIRVTAKSAATVTAVLVSGAAPQVGQVFVTFDHLSDASKRGRIYLTSRESGAPFIAVSEGAGTGVWGSGSEKARLGLLDGLTIGGRTMGDVFTGDPQATGLWGLVTQRALLTGQVIVGDVNGAHISVSGSTLAFNGAGNALITALGSATLTLAASRIDLSGVVTALNGGTYTRITGGAIETGTITGQHLNIAGSVVVGKNLASTQRWDQGQGTVFIGTEDPAGLMPLVRVQAFETLAYVEMAYRSWADWGIRGSDTSGSIVFQLGSTNQIASWAFTPTRLSATLGGATTALVAGETLATYGAFRGLLVESGGAARVLVGDVALPSDLAYAPTSLTGTIPDAGFEAASGAVTGSVGNESPSAATAGWTLAAFRNATAEIQAASVYAGAKALRLYAPKAYAADGYGYVAPYAATATTWVPVAAGNRGRTMRLSLRVRTGTSIFDLGWLGGAVSVRARTAAPNSEWTVVQRVWADVGLGGSWQQVVIDFVCPADAVDVGVEVRVEGPRETDAGSPAWVDAFADALELSVFDRSVSLLGPRGLWVYASPLASLRLTDTGVDMTTAQIQTLGLCLMDAGVRADPPPGQAVVFKRGRDLYVRFADGTEKRVQLV